MNILVDHDLAFFIQQMASTNGISTTVYANSLLEKGRAAELVDLAHSARTFTDRDGKIKRRDEVLEIAADNIRNSGMEQQTLECYLNSQTDEELLEWATNDEGRFSYCDAPDEEE